MDELFKDNRSLDSEGFEEELIVPVSFQHLDHSELIEFLEKLKHYRKHVTLEELFKIKAKGRSSLKDKQEESDIDQESNQEDALFKLL